MPGIRYDIPPGPPLVAQFFAESGVDPREVDHFVPHQANGMMLDDLIPALHLENAGFATGDLSYTYQMTGIIQQMVAVIEQSYGLPLDSGSVSVGRFVTHLRYLFVRIHQHRQLSGEHSTIGVAIRDAYPRAAECAVRLAALLELRLGASLTDDEVSYLSLHVARVTTDDDAA